MLGLQIRAYIQQWEKHNMAKKMGFFVLVAAVMGMACHVAGGHKHPPGECTEGDSEGEGEEEEAGSRAVRMQNFIKNLSAYARGLKPGFIVVPQNGVEVAFHNGNASEGLSDAFMRAIDGFGVEALFYNGRLSIERDVLSMLRTLKNSPTSPTIVVADYVSNNANLADSRQRSKNEGFLASPRSAENDNYQLIPAIDSQTENANDILVLSDAKNWLYLIGADYSSKQAMLNAIGATNYDVVLMDLFFWEEALTPADLQRLKRKANGGQRLVISYVSIGSAETYRYYWQPGWRLGNPIWLVENYAGYPDEFRIQYWHSEWQAIIFGNDNSYMKKIVDAGFDGAFLDNVDTYCFLSDSN